MKKILSLLLLLLSCTSMAGQPVTSADPQYFANQSVNPPTISGTGVVFGKTASGKVELFGMNSFGEAVQLTAGGYIPSGSLNISGVFAPNIDDGATLGSFSKAWSDLYLADGGIFYTNTLKTPEVYGSDIVINGSFNDWISPTELTNWDILDFGGSLDRESVKVHTAPYAVKFTESPAGGQKVIGQLRSGLNSSYVYRARFYAATDNVGSGKMSSIFLNGNDLMTAKIWNFSTEAWDVFAGDPTDDHKYDVSLTSDYALYTTPSIAVPETNNIYIIMNGSGSGGDVTYLDNVSFSTYVPANQVTLFEFKSVSDGGDLGGLDYIFRYRDVNGSSLFGMLATGEFVTASGVFDFSSEPIKISSIQGNYEQDSLVFDSASDYFSDDEELNLPVSSGWGEVFVGDNEERARFSWTSAGVVTLMENTANVVSSDTDSKFCIFQNSTHVTIKNRLGSEKLVKYRLNY